MDIIKYNKPKGIESGSNTIIYKNSESKELETHTIFGQPFNGTQDVMGDITNASNIVATGDISTNGKVILKYPDVEDLTIATEEDKAKFTGKNIYDFDKQIKAKALSVEDDTILNNVESQNITNSNTITTKNLEVTGAAHFFELVIDKVKAAGGAVLFTPANGFDITKIESITGGYKLYWLAGESSNMWKVNDQALCMSFNQNNNKYYWCLVTAVSTSPIVIDNDKYHYIVISKTIKDGTVNPEIGDTITMLGYRGTDDTDRQSAIYAAAYKSLDKGIKAPLIAQYKGINDFNLESHRHSYFDAKGAKFIGDFEISAGQTIQSYINNGIQSSVSNINKVIASTSEQRRNLIAGSYLKKITKVYGIDQLKANIVQGKKYTFSVNGYCTQELINKGMRLQTFIFDATWSKLSIGVSIDSISPVTKSITFTAPYTGELFCSFYPYKQNMTTVETQNIKDFIIVNWCQLEEGDFATPWTLAKGEPDVRENLISDKLSDLVTLSNTTNNKSEIINNGCKLQDGTTFDCVHSIFNTTTDYYDLISTDVVLEPNKTYTLSFYAKGKGHILSYLYPNAVIGWMQSDNTIRVDNNNANSSGDGNTATLLTNDWKHYTISWTTAKDINGSKKLLIARLTAPTKELYLAAPKLEIGGNATRLDITKSIIKQTADDIMLKVKNTGINIEDGTITLKADKTTINGNLNIQGQIRKGLTIINNRNVANYIEHTETGDRILFEKAGSLVRFEGRLNDEIGILTVPCIYPDSVAYNADYARSFVGQTVLIYNKSNTTMALTGAILKKGTSTPFVSPSISTNSFIVLVCKCSVAANGFEQIYWEYEIGKIR